jgi:hypothetical protein
MFLSNGCTKIFVEEKRGQNMEKADYQMIGYVGVVLGAILLLAGIFAATYYEIRGWIIYYSYYPYAQYSGSLIITGIVLLVIGAAFLWRAELK